MIDEEVRKLVDMAYTRTKNLLTDKIDAVRLIAEQLLKNEVLYKDDMEVLIGKRPFAEEAPPVEMNPPTVGGPAVEEGTF